jgi:tRNA-intron endonuclease, archaea type
MKKEKAIGTMQDTGVILEKNDEAFVLHDKGFFGAKDSTKNIFLSFEESLYLLDTERLVILSGKKEISRNQLIQKAKKNDKRFLTRYAVYHDLRSKGNIVKTALKYGADFRIYSKGTKIGKDHSSHLLYAMRQEDNISMIDLSGKARVAHSTRKKLMVGIVDSELDVTYYELSWVRP